MAAHRSRIPIRSFALTAIGLLVSCIGEIGNSTQFDDTGSPSGPGSSSAAKGSGNLSCPSLPALDFIPARVRRLTESEYAATTSAIIGAAPSIPITFPNDSASNGYSNRADQLRVTSILANTLWTDTPVLAQQAADRIMASPPCDTKAAEEPCARQILESAAEVAYRRPVESGEIDGLWGVFRVGREGLDFKGSLALVLRVVLQSAGALYHTEIGSGSSAVSVQLTPYEIADQLSYLITGGPPDAGLRQAAASGAIVSADERARSAKVLLDSASAHPALGNFAAQWMEITSVAGRDRDVQRYPQWPALREKVVSAAKQFVSAALLDDNGNLASLFTANWTVSDAALNGFYGGSPNGAPSGRAFLAPAQAAGVLSQPAFLAAHAQDVDGSPIQRGHFVRARIFCQNDLEPPKDLVITVPPPDPTRTNRERFAGHSSNATCWTCHRLMDPIGFGFESFDAIGHFRTTDNGKPVDASGNLTETDVDGDFNGVVELGQKLAESEASRACFAGNWLEYAMGRAVDDSATCALRALAPDFLAGKSSVRDLVIALVSSDVFVKRAQFAP